MPYTELLNRLIEDSKLAIKEIAERCNENGQAVTASYISLLRNTETKRIPSDELSRALAIACKAKYENVLVVEGYIDNAPEEISDIFYKLRSLSVRASFGASKDEISDDEIDYIVSTRSHSSLAEFIIELAGQETNEMEDILEGMDLYSAFPDDIAFNIQNGLPVDDDSMSPVLPKDSRIILESKEILEYNNDDILCFSITGKKGIRYRKCAFVNKDHSIVAMIPLNSQYSSRVYNIDDIVVFGKVKQCITSF